MDCVVYLPAEPHILKLNINVSVITEYVNEPPLLSNENGYNLQDSTN